MRAASAKRARVARAAASQVKSLARSGPRLPASSRNVSSSFARSIAEAMAPGSRGSGRRPASPTTSGSDDEEDATTGIPSAIASRAGRPKPS